MEVKSETDAFFDINNICRSCLSDKGEMRSLFLAVDNPESGRTMVIAEMIMTFCSVQVENNDGLPSSICLQCFHNINAAFSFKQICEQSDSNLRQYLGKPLNPQDNREEELKKKDVTNLFLDGFGLYSSSGKSDDADFKDDFPSLESVPDNTNDEKSDSNLRQYLGEPLSPKDNREEESEKNDDKNLFLDGFGLYSSSGKSDDEDFKEDFSLLESVPDNTNDEKLITDEQVLKASKMHKSKITKKNLLKNGTKTTALSSNKLKIISHQCDVCKKTFINTKCFCKHLQIHIEDTPFKCKLCPKECYAENSLLKHMKIHEKKEGDPALLKHVCDYCKLEFPDNETLSIHIKQHTGDRPFLCNMCGKSFPQRFNLELHLRTHTGERPFQCEVCKNRYISKSTLKIHMRTHTNERPFVCDFCGKAFRQSGDLTSHKRLHGTEKPIECNICLKRFTTVMKLKYHMRNHTGERPYVCTVCGRGFTVNTILLRHMRVHSGERPYECVTCGKAFSQSSTLNTHKKVHANPQSPKYQETIDQKMPKYHEASEPKFQQPPPQQQPQQTI